MKVVVIDPLSPAALNKLKQEVDLCYIPNSSIELVNKNLQKAEILVMRSSHTLTNAMVDSAKYLKVVIRAGNGTENIPIDYLSKKGIYFSNIRGVSDNSVAEYALALMLLGLRNLFDANDLVKSGSWEKERFIGNEIYGKTVGLLGFGNIGKRIAGLIKPLGVNILYNNNTGPVKDIDFEFTDKRELFSRSDIVCIQVPLNSSTYKIVNRDILTIMKSSSILINLSRYDTIDMDGLNHFFVNGGTLKGVFVDPFERKHLSDVPTFSNFPVYFLPHLGANTYEAQDRIGEYILKIIHDIKKENYGK